MSSKTARTSGDAAAYSISFTLAMALSPRAVSLPRSAPSVAPAFGRRLRRLGSSRVLEEARASASLCEDPGGNDVQRGDGHHGRDRAEQPCPLRLASRA